MESFAIPQMTFARFNERFEEKALSRRIPVNGALELTFRCNLSCTHCYCNLPAEDPKALQEELTTKEVLSILDQVVDAGCIWLLITGGEPLIREDFLEIYTHAKRKGLMITLFTNGTLITPGIADHLAAWPPHDLEIALYGASPETYGRVTGNQTAFQDCLRGIRLLRERNIPCDLKTLVTVLNRDELPQIRALAEQWGLTFRFDTIVSPRLDGGRSPCGLRLTPQEIVALDLNDEKRARAMRREFKRTAEADPQNRLFRCGAGTTSFHIDPYGKARICDMCRFQTSDLRSGSFRDAWDSDFPRLLTTGLRTDSPCHACPWMNQCDSCAGWSWMENGSLEDPVDFQCEITHLRASHFG